MYSNGYDWREEPQGTALSSVLLLLVFVSAAAFLLGMVWLRPWADEAPVTPLPEAQASPPPEPAPPAVEAPEPAP
jgi:hypothetical protein